MKPGLNRTVHKKDVKSTVQTKVIHTRRPVECSTMGGRLPSPRPTSGGGGGERVGVGGEGRDLCYSGPLNAVTSFIYYFSFKKK